MSGKQAYKFILAVMAVCMLSFVVLAGCGARQANQPVTVKLAVTSGPLGEWVTAAMAEFEKENSLITVEISQSPALSYREGLLTMLAGGDAPDVAFLWGGAQYLPSLSAANLLLDLDPYFESLGWKDIIPQDGNADNRVNGKNYSVPVDTIFNPVIFYNKRIFEEVGVSVPETEAELKEISQKIKAKGYGALGFAGKDQWLATNLFDAIMPRLMEDEEYAKLLMYAWPEYSDEVTYMHPAVLKAFRIFEDWVKEGIIVDDVNGIGYDDANSLFASGKFAMLSNGSWEIDNLANLLGEDLGYFPVPQFDPSIQVGVSGNLGNVFAISNNSKYKDESVKILDYLVSREAQSLYIEDFGVLTVRNDMADDVNEHLHPIYVDLLDKRDHQGYPMQRLNFGMNSPAELLVTHMTVLQEVIGLTKTPEAAQQELEAKAQQLRQ